MADLQSSLEETILQCPICTETYTKPKRLPCLHTFCEHCLHSYITGLTAKGPLADGFHCPVCRDPTPAPVTDTPCDKWAEHFPSNHLIVSLQDTISMRQGGKKCYPCGQADKQEIAFGWCQTCDECLCQNCTEYHKRLKMNRNHTVLSIADMNKQPINVTSPHDLCSEHRDKKIKFYCVDHSTLCCSTCVAITHRKCDDVKTIQDLAAQIRTNNEHTDLIKTFGLYIDHASVLVSHCVQVLQKLPSHKGETVKEIRSIREKMNTLLLELEQTVTDELDSLHKDSMSRLEDKMADCDSLRKAMENSRTVLQTTIDHGSESQLFQTIHKLNEESCRFGKRLFNEHISIMDVQYAFVRNKKIDDLMESLSELGSVKRISAPIELPVCPGRKPFAVLEAEKMSTINGRTPNTNTTPLLIDAVLTHDKRIILTDYTNKTVKMYSEEGQYINQLQLPSGPWGVTSIDNDTLVVALPEKKCVQFVSIVGDQLTADRSISVQGICRKATCVDSRLFVVCDTTVRILSIDGQDLGAITTDGAGQPLFLAAYYISFRAGLNPDQSLLYVSDYSKGKVVCLTLEGQCEWTYSDVELRGPMGIAVDVEGNSYVCGNKSNNVHQVSADGKKIKILLNPAACGTQLRGIAFDSEQATFAITKESDSNVANYRLA